MANFLVTGAAGFIGAAITNKLIKQGHNVTTVDNLSTGYIENIPKGVEFIEMDCQNPKIHKTLPREKFEAIFHVAGQSSGEISFENPTYDLRTNTESTLNLLKFSLSVGCRRFIYASSVYVHSREGGFYRCSKQASEAYIEEYHKAYGLDYTILQLDLIFLPILSWREFLLFHFLMHLEHQYLYHILS